MDIKEFHRYNRLVRRGFANPLMCDRCENPYTLIASEDGDPILKCYFCYTICHPGTKIYRSIQAVNAEFYIPNEGKDD